jgi:hypothetical protein
VLESVLLPCGAGLTPDDGRSGARRRSHPRGGRAARMGRVSGSRGRGLAARFLFPIDEVSGGGDHELWSGISSYTADFC